VPPPTKKKTIFLFQQEKPALGFKISVSFDSFFEGRLQLELVWGLYWTAVPGGEVWTE
jgi:hypothetical protein